MDSPTIEGTDGYQRKCQDCGGTMDWMWGGPNTYFQCNKCKRIEPVPDIVIERNQVVKIQGNRREAVCHFEDKDREKVIRTVLGE